MFFDPEHFVRGGPTLATVFLVDEGRENQNTTISGPTSAHQRNTFKWRFADVPMMTKH